jgi:hypothetical protein
MQIGPKTVTNTRQQKPAQPFLNRTRRWTSSGPSGGSLSSTRLETKDPQNARKHFERYLALAQAEMQAGNTIDAENFYQHAEHYFRSMSSDRDAT